MKHLLPLFCLALSTQGFARVSRPVPSRNMAWTSLVAEVPISTKWSLINNAEYRLEFPHATLFQWGLRSSLCYKIRKRITASAGGAYFQHYSEDGNIPPKQEVRTWQEVACKLRPWPNITLVPRLRIEQRFMTPSSEGESAKEYSFHSHRVRLRLEFNYDTDQINLKKCVLVAGDEIMFQRNRTGFCSLDQNRIWAGFGYKVSELLTAQLTYMHLYQQKSSAIPGQSHIVRFALHFVLTKNKNTSQK